MQRNATQHDVRLLTVDAKETGMSSCELSPGMVRELARDEYPNTVFTSYQILAAYHRAAGYCFGEYAANEYETEGRTPEDAKQRIENLRQAFYPTQGR